MNRWISLTYFILVGWLFSCESKSKADQELNYTALSQEERLEIAITMAKQTILVDGHVDLPYRMQSGGFTLQGEILDVSKRSEDGNFDFPRAKEGGLDAPFMSIYVPVMYQSKGGAKGFADSLILLTERIATAWPDKFAMAYSPADIVENFKAGKISLPLGMENGAPLEDDLDNISYFYKKGIRYITLTHGKDNLIGDSSYDTTRTHGGLSAFGKGVVGEMNRMGIMVDVSHVSDATFFQVMKVTKTPVIASHSSVRHYTPGFERNMSDGMIKALAQNGGVIMINFGGDFIDQEFREQRKEVNAHIANWLKENGLAASDSSAKAYMEGYVAENQDFPDLSRVADHFDHVVNLVGIDHVGIGSDFDGVGDTLPIGLKDVSMYPHLIAELLKRGYSREDIEKICYKNIFRVWKEVEAYALRN